MKTCLAPKCYCGTVRVTYGDIIMFGEMCTVEAVKHCMFCHSIKAHENSPKKALHDMKSHHDIVMWLQPFCWFKEP